MPVLYIITGSNGAGKSSVGPDYIPASLRQSIFDGDKLFMQKRSEFWLNGIKSHKECKRLAADFVETTFDSLVESSLATKPILHTRVILQMMQRGKSPKDLKTRSIKYI